MKLINNTEICRFNLLTEFLPSVGVTYIYGFYVINSQTTRIADDRNFPLRQLPENSDSYVGNLINQFGNTSNNKTIINQVLSQEKKPASVRQNWSNYMPRRLTAYHEIPFFI